jgi:glycosyltransferase involved in cell wall biosynthesis
MPDTVCLVIPCYDEADRLRRNAPTFARYLDERPEHVLLFVDDASRDGTGERIALLAAGRGNCLQLRMPTNVGKAEAVRAGMRVALESTGCAFYGYLDADLATPLEEIGRLLQPFQDRPELLLAMGCRLASLGRDIQRSMLRHYAGRVMATAIAHTLGLPVYDSQCGAKLFRHTPLFPRLWSEPFTSRWLFDVEILARMMRLHPRLDFRSGEEVLEVPLGRWTHVPGSKVGAGDFFSSFADLARILRVYRDVLPQRRPLSAP